jgi:hypothetical protein
VTAPGAAFIGSVRQRFARLWAAYELSEVGTDDNLNYASVVAMNGRYYLRFSCDFRDRWIEVGLGRLSEELVPTIPLAPPQTADNVRELPSAIIVWDGTGDRELAFSLGTYDEETSTSIEEAVRRMADVLGEQIRPLLDGDDLRWRRASELAVSRVWRP